MKKKNFIWWLVPNLYMALPYLQKNSDLAQHQFYQDVLKIPSTIKLLTQIYIFDISKNNALMYIFLVFPIDEAYEGKFG